MRVKSIHRLNIKTHKIPVADQIRFYWRRESLEAVTTILKRFSNPGDTILDPFCGSGTTGLAAAGLNRKAFLSDISPAGFFITKALNEKIPDRHMNDKTKIILASIRELREEIYGCYCPRCGGRNAYVSYTVFETIFIKPYFQFHPVKTIIHCRVCGNGVDSFEPANTRNFSLDITALQYDRIFSALNQKALRDLKKLVDGYKGDEWLYPKLNAVFMGTAYEGSLFRSKNGKVSLPDRHAFPGRIYEKNCCDIFAARLKSLARFNHNLPTGNGIELNRIRIDLKPAWNMAGINSQTIDLCYYDIPYGSDFVFSRLNAIWEAWLEQKTDQSEEIYFINHDQASHEQYYRKLLPVFKEAFRVLKPGLNLLIPFSSRYVYIYPYIERAALDAGFRVPDRVSGGLADHVRIINGRSQYYLLNFSKD